MPQRHWIASHQGPGKTTLPSEGNTECQGPHSPILWTLLPPTFRLGILQPAMQNNVAAWQLLPLPLDSWTPSRFTYQTLFLFSDQLSNCLFLLFLWCLEDVSLLQEQHNFDQCCILDAAHEWERIWISSVILTLPGQLTSNTFDRQNFQRCLIDFQLFIGGMKNKKIANIQNISHYTRH